MKDGIEKIRNSDYKTAAEISQKLLSFRIAIMKLIITGEMQGSI